MDGPLSWLQRLAGQSPTAATMVVHDWAATPLGDPDTWPESLRVAVRLCLTSDFPIMVAWGHDLRMIYNESYRAFLGDKHPAVGQPVSVCFAEIWPDLQPLFAEVGRTGLPFTADEMPFVMDRQGFPEETFFRFGYSPIYDGDEIRGFFDLSVETTREVLAERRLAQIGELAASMVGGRDVTDVSTAAVSTLTGMSGTPGSPGSADVVGAEIRLWVHHQLVPLATSGFVDQHALDDETLARIDGPEPIVLDNDWRPGRPARHVALAVGSDNSRGVLALALNPLLPFDAGHRSFVELVGRAIGAMLENAYRRSVELGEQRLISETLQAAMLAPASNLPTVAARYRPAAGQLSVGGDWYDVISLADGRRALVVGDCVGHGLDAATAMGQLRSASRALLLEGRSPAEVVQAMDRFAASVRGGDCATMVCAVIDLGAGTATYSIAGHLPPLLVHRGVGTWLEHHRGTPLGVGSAPRAQAVARIHPDDLLVFCTDGLVERRSEVIDAGLERLRTAALRHAHEPVQTIADALIDELLEPLPSDDVVVLVKRVH